MSKGSVYLNIPRIVRVITIWAEILFKIIMSFDELVSRKKVLLESIQLIERQFGVFVEVFEVHSSVSFEFCVDKEFIKFW